jgi:hypothetical protein
MDKQTLKKHHFWFLLALSVILVPVVLLGAVFSVGRAAVEAKSKIDKRNEELVKAAPKCQEYLANLDKNKSVLEQQRDKVWKEVYDAQAGLIHWPQRLAHLDNLYFGDIINEHDRSVFRDKNVYLNEYWQMPSIIAPTEFLDGDWSKRLQHQPEWAKVPTSEECWLALETLCVQREILKDVQAINQMLARFQPVPRPVGRDAKPEEKEEFAAEKARVDKEVREALKVKDGDVYGRFVSPYWQLDLAFSRVTTGKGRDELVFRGILTNISGRRQNVAKIDFEVWLKDRDKDPTATPAIVSVQKDFLSAGESYAFEDVRVDMQASSNQIYGVTQKLDMRYAPVKRIDQLVLGYPSHRYAGQPLLPPVGPAFKEATDAEAAAAAAASTEGGGFGRPTAANRPSANSMIPRNRYLHRTDQVRRMPIALVLVVDQSHVQDVQRALANSRLRFQNVQIHWQRFRGTLNLGGTTAPSMTTGAAPKPTGDASPRPAAPPGLTSGATGAGANEIGSFNAPPAGSAVPGPRAPSPGVLGRGRGAPGEPSTGATAQPVEETMPSLVELTIYGIASLYERYPPRPPGAVGANASQGGSSSSTPPAPPPPPPPPPAARPDDD